jgi:phosphate uptake regulator
MKRRIIGQHDSFTITLPKKWVEDNNLKGKDEVDLSISDRGALVIATERREAVKKITLHAEHDSFETLKILISNTYKSGFSNITLLSKKSISLKNIRKVVDGLIGLELIGHTEGKFELKVISQFSQEDFDLFVRKLFLNVKISLEELTIGKYDEIKEYMREVHKLGNYLRRLCNSLPSTLSKPYNILFVRLANMATNLYEFSNNIKRDKKSYTKILQEILDYYTDLQNVYYKKEYTALVGKAFKKKEELFSDLFKLPNNKARFYAGLLIQNNYLTFGCIAAILFEKSHASSEVL